MIQLLLDEIMKKVLLVAFCMLHVQSHPKNIKK